MDSILRGYDYFRRNLFPKQKNHYAELARGQRPPVMFVVCSDSRLCLRRLFGVKPGEAFTYRNPGNIITPYGTVMAGDQAALELGVSLGVKHIIVLGHSDCGAMRLLLSGAEKIKDTMPAVHRMLCASCTDTADLTTDADMALEELTKRHIRQQLQNLETYPVIQEARQKGELAVHGWIFQIEQGKILRFDERSNAFSELGE